MMVGCAVTVAAMWIVLVMAILVAGVTDVAAVTLSGCRFWTELMVGVTVAAALMWMVLVVAAATVGAVFRVAVV